jgi:hypothetical protein
MTVSRDGIALYFLGLLGLGQVNLVDREVPVVRGQLPSSAFVALKRCLIGKELPGYLTLRLSGRCVMRSPDDDDAVVPA